MAVIDLEDLHGHIEVVIFTRLYAKVFEVLEDENILLIDARVEASGENLRKLIATRIQSLRKKTRKREVKPLTAISISIPDVNKVDEQTLQHVTQILNTFRGKVPTTVGLQIGEKRCTLVGTPPTSPDGFRQLEKLPGMQCKASRTKKERD